MQATAKLQSEPEVAEALRKILDNESLSTPDHIQLESFLLTVLWTYWNQYQHRLDKLNVRDWEDSRTSIADIFANIPFAADCKSFKRNTSQNTRLA